MSEAKYPCELDHLAELDRLAANGVDLVETSPEALQEQSREFTYVDDERKAIAEMDRLASEGDNVLVSAQEAVQTKKKGVVSENARVAFEVMNLLVLKQWDAADRMISKLRNQAAPTPADPKLLPTAGAPLRGLQRLGPLVLVGRDRILAKANEPVSYAWQDIAVTGTIVMIAGEPSGGKTTLAFLAVVTRANLGEPVMLLGREVTPAPPGTFVILIEGEHSEGSTARKLLRSCEIMGVDPACLDRVIIVARKAVRLGSLEWEDVIKMVAAGIVSDIFLDTVARVAPGDANDEREQVAIFDIVTMTIDSAPSDATKPTAWALAHTKKGATGSLEDVSGSTQRTGQADSVLLMRGEKEGGRTISSTVTFAKLREEPDDYPEPVTFAIVVENCRRTIRQTNAPQPNDDRPIEVRILEALATGAKTKNALATKLGRSGTHIEEAITNLFAERAITTSTKTVNGRTFRAFVLRKEHPTEHPTRHFSEGTR